MQNKKQIISTLLSVAISVCLVTASVYAVTTINANISTAGTLDVTDATTLASTLSVAGAATLSTASTSGSFWLGNVVNDDDDFLYMDASGTEYLEWDDDPGEFVFSDDINVGGNATIAGNATTSGYIYTGSYIKLEAIATPTPLTAGLCFIDSTDKQLNCYDGSAWAYAY